MTEPTPDTMPEPLPPVPVSAPAPAPVSGPWGYPTSGYPSPVQPPVPTRMGPLLWVLVGVSALLFIVVGALTYLQSAERASGREVVAERDAEIDELRDRVRQLERANGDREDDVSDAEEDLADTRALNADLEQCPSRVQEYTDALLAQDEDAFEEAVRNVLDTCHVI